MCVVYGKRSTAFEGGGAFLFKMNEEHYTGLEGITFNFSLDRKGLIWSEIAFGVTGTPLPTYQLY